MTRSRQTSLVLADDHVMVVEAMRMLLDRSPDLDVLGVARDGHALLSLVEAGSPDIALVDLSMPGPSPTEIARQIARLERPCKLIALTMHLEPQLARSLMASGYAGYVIKESAVSDLFEAIHQVVSGGTYISPALALLETDFGAAQRLLTPRETECLRTAADGLSNKAIAAQLNVSLRTVKYHFENVFRKLNVRSRSEAIAVGRKRGLF